MLSKKTSYRRAGGLIDEDCKRLYDEKYEFSKFR